MELTTWLKPTSATVTHSGTGSGISGSPGLSMSASPSDNHFAASLYEGAMTTQQPSMEAISKVEEGAMVNVSIFVAEGILSEHWLSFEPVSYPFHVGLGILVSLITILAISGNGLVIYLYFKFKSLQTPANLLVLNLALSDLLMVATGFPLFVIASFKGTWPFGRIGCEIYGGSGAFFGLMSINTMAAIAIDRCIAINREKKQTRSMAVLSIAAVWVYSALWAVPPLLGWSRYTLEGFQTTCSYDYLTRDSTDKYFLLAVIIGDYTLPLFIIFYCYSKIMHKFKVHQREYQTILEQSSCNQRSDIESSVCSQSSVSYARSKSVTSAVKLLSRNNTKKKSVWSKTEYKVARTILMVVIIYTVAWTPYAIVALIGQYGNSDLITPMVAMVPIMIAKMSTVPNPFIYAIMHPRFRSALKKTFPQLLTEKTMNRSKNRAVKGRKSITEQPIIIELDNLLGSSETTEAFKDSVRQVDEEVGNGSVRVNEVKDTGRSRNKAKKGVQAQTELLLSILQQTAQTNPEKRIVLTFKSKDGGNKLYISRKERGEESCSESCSNTSGY